MIKMNSISGILCLVKDLDKTTEFYEKLGFNFKTRTPDYATAYLNQFWIEFVAQDKVEKSVFQKEADVNHAGHRGAGLFVHFNVQNTDDFYDAILAKGLKPSSEPKDFLWGRREFVIRDPDGYRLVFFQNI
jgi:catechol 2,3-dioxygenase-like lactoylglutathione lyase family enzyme